MASGHEQSPFVNSYTLPMPDPARTFAGPGYSASPPGTSGLAIAALLLGCLGVLFYAPAVAGIICGVLALRHIRRTNVGGIGVATAGLVISSVATAGWSLILAAIWVTGF
ncbi:DUF4190 domain-containing protein [Ruania rhizosphaerae]|uniref:DUF4190 domain-containing protein n=1 Tax=Ruania rhizosphaerae TaxID=1840413 RepID=UPI00135A9D66|nr:DUF4190 domain-containing protein [Ruania rhizosphaerae]